MMPSARLTQGSFEDLDLICADNFARAAARHGVRHMVYLGGLLPASHEGLSRHLQSRFEVEQTLGAHGVPVTTLRAGLVIGAGGSSFDMMAKLVGRLPVMLAPRWTRSLTQPIALDDVLTLLVACIDRPSATSRAYDIGCPDVVSYADMLRMTGDAQQNPIRIITLPVRTVRLSLLWVSAITGASQSLVRPLVESLSHDMIATDGLSLQHEIGLAPIPLRQALERAVRDEAALKATRKAPARARRPAPKVDRRACSVQRLRVSPGQRAADVAMHYLAWLPQWMSPLLRVTVDEQRQCRFFFSPIAKPLLELRFSPERSAPDRQLFFVTGGLLAGEAGSARPRLEFREVLGGTHVLAAVHDFVPRLPWFIYKYTQALVHLLVMWAFARELTKREP